MRIILPVVALALVACASKAPLSSASQTDLAARSPSAADAAFVLPAKPFNRYSNLELASAIIADGTKRVTCRSAKPYTITAQTNGREVKSAMIYSTRAPASLKAMDLFVNGERMCHFRAQKGELVGTPASHTVDECSSDLKVKLYEECCARGKSCTELL